jgi:sugar phosphate isomerase/epimerase
MEIGIFGKVFNRPTLAETLDAVAAHNLHWIQFNMVSAGVDSMPDAIPPELVASIRSEMDARSMRMAALSGTFNMIHPDPQVRQDGLRRLRVLAEICQPLRVDLLTLCTGTRDPENMWRRHPDNDTPAAWHDLTHTMEQALRIADDFNLNLGVETEVSNVVDSAPKARRLIDQMQSPRLKIIIDCANIFHKGELARMHAMMDEAFDLLGDHIALAHAKDLKEDGDAGQEAAGTGVLDFAYYARQLQKIGYQGAWVLHGLNENQVAASIAFLQKILSKTVS